MSEDVLILRLGKAEYRALKSTLVLDPDAEAMMDGATPAGQGFVLKGSWATFDELAGCVAAEANHTDSAKQQETLDKIYDKIEGLLG